MLATAATCIGSDTLVYMQANRTDEDWESFAQSDPYWAVLTADEFRGSRPAPEALDRFFQTGAGDIESITRILRRRFGAPARFGTSLDFGCGVGRLLIPLAAVSETAIGMDVAPSMLAVCVKTRMNVISKISNYTLATIN